MTTRNFPVTALVAVAAVSLATGSGSAETNARCEEIVKDPICSIAQGQLTINVQAAAQLDTSDGYETAKDEAFLNAAALVGEIIVGLKCKNGKCDGITDVAQTCPSAFLDQEKSRSFSSDLNSMTWEVACSDDTVVLVNAEYRQQMCRVIHRLGTYCLGDY